MYRGLVPLSPRTVRRRLTTTSRLWSKFTFLSGHNLPSISSRVINSPGRSSSRQSRSTACPLSLTGFPRALRPLRRSSNSKSPNAFTTAAPIPSGSRFRSYMHDSLRGKLSFCELDPRALAGLMPEPDRASQTRSRLEGTNGWASQGSVGMRHLLGGGICRGWNFETRRRVGSAMDREVPAVGLPGERSVRRRRVRNSGWPRCVDSTVETSRFADSQRPHDGRVVYACR